MKRTAKEEPQLVSRGVVWRRSRAHGEHFVVTFPNGHLYLRIAGNSYSEHGFRPLGEDIGPVSALGRYRFRFEDQNFIDALMLAPALVAEGRA